MIDSMFVRESLLQEKTDGKVRCHVCGRRCTIGAGGAGWCRTRQNRDGRLVTLIYGAASSIAVNPIEKKPFYHFYPGTLTLTAGSWSCNFGCPWCQNWDISKTPPPRAGEYVSPERFVELAENYTCQGTSISFNEPTLSLEWSLDVFHLARRRDLYNTYVTNGYMTLEALSLLIDAGLDAMNVDVKGDAVAVRKYCKGIDVDKVWAVCKLARSRGVHIEVTTLVIPIVNDSDAVLRSIAERVVNDLGPDVPWHVTGYYPAYKFTAPPTSIRTLERAWRIGKDAGLKFVYVGNVAGHRYDDTYCPTCNTLLIRRRGFDVLLNAVRRGQCPRCNHPIAGVWGEE
jgi:pyruvate formate lyase activating enzyme